MDNQRLNDILRDIPDEPQLDQAHINFMCRKLQVTPEKYKKMHLAMLQDTLNGRERFARVFERHNQRQPSKAKRK